MEEEKGEERLKERGIELNLFFKTPSAHFKGAGGSKQNSIQHKTMEQNKLHELTV